MSCYFVTKRTYKRNMVKWIDIVDGCYCISLRSREDRFQKIQDELKRVGLHDMTEYYRPEKHPKGGRVGCWYSHAHIMQLAEQKKQRFVLILEDDAKFLPNLELNRLHKAVQIFKNWPAYIADILYLGHVPYWMKPTIFPQIYETRSLTTHAYIANIHGSLCQQIIRNPTFYDSIDIVFFKHAKAFTIFPMMVIQKDNGESNVQNKPRWLQKFTEQQLWPRIHILEELMILQPYHFLVFMIVCVLFLNGYISVGKRNG